MPSLLLTETPLTVGRSLNFFHVIHSCIWLILPPSCLAACGHHLSPRIEIVLSLPSIIVHQTPPCHHRLFLSSPLLTHLLRWGGTHYHAWPNLYDQRSSNPRVSFILLRTKNQEQRARLSRKRWMGGGGRGMTPAAFCVGSICGTNVFW